MGTVKKADVKILQCAALFMTMTRDGRPVNHNAASIEVSKTLLDVMNAAGKVIHRVENGRIRPDRNDYFMVVALDRELESWYRGLPETIQWNQYNIQTCGSDFFLFQYVRSSRPSWLRIYVLMIHSQHYYMALILLHRPFAQFKRSGLLDEDDGITSAPRPDSDRLCQLSRMVCFDHAVALAQIFKLHHSRFGGRRMLFPAVGHADICATTLSMTMVYTKDSRKRDKALGHLRNLLEILKDMGTTYLVAQKMSKALENAMRRPLPEFAEVASPSPSLQNDLRINNSALLQSSVSQNQGAATPGFGSITNPEPNIGLQPFTSPSSLGDYAPGLIDSINQLLEPNQIQSLASLSQFNPYIGEGIDMPYSMPESGGWDQRDSWDLLLNSDNTNNYA